MIVLSTMPGSDMIALILGLNEHGRGHDIATKS